MERKPIIEIRSLSKTFRGKNAEVHALQDINLKIEQGDIFGIIGMSGAGKSTLVRCMNTVSYTHLNGVVAFHHLTAEIFGKHTGNHTGQDQD